MDIYGLDSVRHALREGGYFLKLIASDNAVYFFTHITEHRDAKQPGLSYDDDSAGNALAATVKPGQIDFRFHGNYSDERVRRIGRQIIDHPDLGFARGFAVTYQGRELISSGSR